jgi:hypothetical protein
MNEQLHKTSFSGADITVYVMVNQMSLYKKHAAVTNMYQNYFDDPFITGGANDVFGETTDPELSDPLISLRRKTALSNITKETNVLTNDFNSSFKQLGELQTLSCSIYRDKEQVKALGQETPRGYTRGYVTFAGSMVFTVFHEAVMAELFKNSFIDSKFNGHRVDQLPPLDIFIVFTNEVGDVSKMAIFGAEFMNEGQVMSVQDLITENSVNYVAKHITRMEAINSPYSMGEDFFGLLTNPLGRAGITLAEFKKAKDEINDQRKYFL